MNFGPIVDITDLTIKYVEDQMPEKYCLSEF